MKWLGALLVICLLILGLQRVASAQTPIAPDAAQFKPEELSQLVAPVALYPDALLSEVLMASTYPLEVVEAERWISANKELKGNDLKSAADKQAWDDSVKSLTATPTVLLMMSGKLDWTQKLGDAVLAQQADVMDAIQELRVKAKAQGKLSSNKQQTVSVKLGQNRQTIAIEPAQPDMIYVPYYDPAVVYGAWPYPAYPPYYWTPPGYIPGAAIATGIAFAAGFAIGAWATHGNYWGGSMNWGGNSININRPVNINNTPAKSWTHNPDHRHGVAYKNANVAKKFAGNSLREGARERMDFRGRNGEQVLRPDGDRASVSPRDGGKRPDAGKQRPSNRSAGGNVRNRAAGARPPGSSAQRGGRENAFSGVNSGRRANAASARGHASFAGRGGMHQASFAGGRMGGGGMRGGGGRGRR